MLIQLVLCSGAKICFSSANFPHETFPPALHKRRIRTKIDFRQIRFGSNRIFESRMFLLQTRITSPKTVWKDGLIRTCSLIVSKIKGALSYDHLWFCFIDNSNLEFVSEMWFELIIKHIIQYSLFSMSQFYYIMCETGKWSTKLSYNQISST